MHSGNLVYLYLKAKTYLTWWLVMPTRNETRSTRNLVRENGSPCAPQGGLGVDHGGNSTGTVGIRDSSVLFGGVIAEQ